MPVKYDWFTGDLVDAFAGDEGNEGNEGDGGNEGIRGNSD